PRPPRTSPLSLHDALPISVTGSPRAVNRIGQQEPALAEARLEARTIAGIYLWIDEIGEIVPYQGDDPVLLRDVAAPLALCAGGPDRKSTRLNSSHVKISYA